MVFTFIFVLVVLGVTAKNGLNQFAGLAIGLDTFGASAPYKVLAEKFGFTPEAVAKSIVDHFSGGSCGCDCGSCGGCH